MTERGHSRQSASSCLFSFFSFFAINIWTGAGADGVSCVDDCHCGVVISAVVIELARSVCNVLLGHCECVGPYPPNVGLCRASCR